MSSDSNQENSQRNVDTIEKIKKNEASEYKSLTFKDWKSLKESQNKSNEKPRNNKNAKPQSTNKTSCAAGSVNKNNYNSFDVPPRATNFHGDLNSFAGNNGRAGFIPINNNLNGINNYNFGMLGNNFGPVNNNFNNFNSPSNNFNRPIYFDGNTFNNRFNNSNGSNNFATSNGINSFGKSLNEGNFNLPDSFFASDGVYRQKDLMQKPLPNYNPFRNAQKANELLQEFDKSTKDYKKRSQKPAIINKSPVPTSDQQTIPGDVRNVSNEPEVYVPNPKAKIDGKPYIPKPKVPEQNFEITKEEKKQQWKEYREAMKPFKNRDFYNARRVVQRLGKKSPTELDDKQIIRLANAREIMAAHKDRLAAKYANYVKANDSSNGLGELYLLKKKPLADTDIPMSTIKQYQNYGNFGKSRPFNDFESGRKIVGGYTGFKGFVAGGFLEGTVSSLSTE